MSVDIEVYGRCPICGAVGRSRERRPNGNDECLNGHIYPSRDAVKAGGIPDEQLLPCPFCGREPRVTSRAASPSEGSPTRHIHFIACMCGGYSARAHQFGYSMEEASKAWNTRSGEEPASANLRTIHFREPGANKTFCNISPYWKESFLTVNDDDAIRAMLAHEFVGPCGLCPACLKAAGVVDGKLPGGDG